MSVHSPNVYMHVARLRMYDHLAYVRTYYHHDAIELPPAKEVEIALWRAIDENGWEKKTSESFRAVMRAIIERDVRQGCEMEAYEAIRIFNRSYIELTNEALGALTGCYYVEDKLEWISHKRVQEIEQDWSLILFLVRTLRHRMPPGRYVKLVSNVLRNHTTAGGRANSEPRRRKKKACRRRFSSEEREMYRTNVKIRSSEEMEKALVQNRRRSTKMHACNRSNAGYKLIRYMLYDCTMCAACVLHAVARA